jgi:hypothetical protein
VKSGCRILIWAFLLTLSVSRLGWTYGVKSDFSQDHRTYSWNFVFDHARDAASGFSLDFLSSVNSTITKRPDGPDWWQEDGRIDFSLGHDVSSRLNLGAFFLQDRYSAEKIRSTTSNAGVSSEFRFAGVTLVQSLGAEFIENTNHTWPQPDRSDQGISLSQSISLSPRILSRARTEVSLSQSFLQLKNIPIQRRNMNLFFSRPLGVSAANGSQDSIQIGYQEAWEKKRFFEGKVQRRSLRDLRVSGSQRFGPGVKLEADAGYLYEKDRRYWSDPDSLYYRFLSSSLVTELRMEKGLWNKVVLEGFYKYMVSEWDYLGDQNDERMEAGDLGGGLSAGITSADSLYLTASIGITSFFAPASGEFNDRDKQTVLLWGQYVRLFGPYLSMRLEGGFNQFQLTYMSEQHSYDNNHDLTYYLSPSFTWILHRRLTLRQSYSVKANYRYYDYQKASESGPNTLLRRASSSSDVAYRASERVTFFAGYTYRYEDEGPLIWKDQWVQKIGQDRRTNSINLSLEYRPWGGLSFSPNYTYEQRKFWNHEALEEGGPDQVTVKEKRVLGNRFFRKLISLTLKYLVDQDHYIYLSAAHRLQDDTMSAQEISNYATVSLAWVF